VANQFGVAAISAAPDSNNPNSVFVLDPGGSVALFAKTPSGAFNKTIYAVENNAFGISAGSAADGSPSVFVDPRTGIVPYFYSSSPGVISSDSGASAFTFKIRVPGSQKGTIVVGL
jgi:hypothetical protein